ncbi:MAG: alpha-amylase family glycosyl hydrolase, partial [Cyanobacteriota bacterium]
DRSPFMEWFTFPNEPGQDFDLGILPQNDAGDILYDKFDIAFENAPVDKKGQSNPDYDETKPTYLKVFDSRQAKQANISFDSIQNYKFAVDPEELKEKFDYATEFETDGRISNSELVEWGNFNLATSDYDSGKLLWDGNRDVLKMNMQNPDVRKYIMGAGTYWTTKVDNTLLNYVSSNINKVLNGQAPDADKVKNAIAQLEKSGVLPQGSSDLTKADIAKAMEDEYIAKTNFTLHGSVKAFPPESIELPREILGVVTNPYFKKQLESLIDSNSFKSLLKDIIKSSKLSETNQQKLESPEIIRLFSEDIAKAILTKAITGVDYVPGQTLPEGWHKQLAEGAEKTLPPQFLQAGPSVAADLLITTIKQNIKNVDKDKIAEALNPKVEQVDTSTVRAAKALLTKMESGLDWRIDAAKDVADMDGVRNGRVSKEEAFKFVSEFWAEFCDKVRNVNPKAFIVGEVTDVPDKDLPNFVQNDGFSTLSNYRYMFGTPYKFVHAHPEVLGWHDGPTAFFNELENFAKAWPVTAVNTAHNMVDNHDKTRVLQNLLIHPGEFKDKGPEFAMAQLMKYALTRAYDVDKKNNTIEKLTKTDPTFAKVYKAIDETAKREGTRFGYWSMDRAIPAVLETAGVKDSQLAAKMSKVLFDDATDKYLRCLYLLVGVPGAPEIYAGTEFAMTGGETISKNVFNQNRNPIPWVWLNGKNAKSEVVDFNNSVKAIFNLRNNKNLSVLNNGFIKDLNHKDD